MVTLSPGVNCSLSRYLSFSLQMSVALCLQVSVTILAPVRWHKLAWFVHVNSLDPKSILPGAVGGKPQRGLQHKTWHDQPSPRHSAVNFGGQRTVETPVCPFYYGTPTVKELVIVEVMSVPHPPSVILSCIGFICLFACMHVWPCMYHAEPNMLLSL